MKNLTINDDCVYINVSHASILDYFFTIVSLFFLNKKDRVRYVEVNSLNLSLNKTINIASINLFNSGFNELVWFK